MVDLAPLHREAAQSTTPGGRFAVWVKGFASRIQNECNNQDFAAIRELAVQAALQADDMAFNVEHGWDEAERMRREQSEREAGRAGGTARVAPSVDTPLAARADAPHAGPTDLQRAPDGARETVPAAPATGERGQSAPAGDGPTASGSPGTPAAVKETRGEPALASSASGDTEATDDTKKPASSSSFNQRQGARR